MVKVDGVRSKPFMMIRSICQGCPLSFLLYALALEPFLCRSRANPVLGGITLAGATTSARYTAYTNDVSTLLMSSAEIHKVRREIWTCETLTGAKIKHNKSVGLQTGS